MIEKVIPTPDDDNPNPREYELLPDGTYRMTMDTLHGGFCYDLDYKDGTVSEMIGFERMDDGYSAAIYQGQGRVVIPREYNGAPVRAIIQPYYPEEAGVGEITEVVIPDTVRRIGSEALQYYSSLTRADIPDSVTSIGDYAFGGDSSLTEIRLPEGVKRVGVGCFLGCTALRRIELPETLEAIDAHAFYECGALESVRIPAAVSSISSDAFRFCDSLSSIEVDAENTTYISKDGNLFSDGGRTLVRYAPAKADGEFSVPAEVLSIGELAFDGASSLLRVVLPSGLTAVGEAAFICCDSLREVTLPKGAAIGDAAFPENVSLILL